MDLLVNIGYVICRIFIVLIGIISRVFWGFFFFLRKINPKLTSAANPPLYAEEDWP